VIGLEKNILPLSSYSIIILVWFRRHYKDVHMPRYKITIASVFVSSVVMGFSVNTSAPDSNPFTINS